MDEVAVEIDKIVTILVTEAEAHACAEQPTQSVNSTKLRDGAESTLVNDRAVDDQADNETAAPSGAAAQHSVDDALQQPLSTSSSQLSAYDKPRQQAPELQQVDLTSAEGLPDRTDFPESLAKNTKLLALKQRRLGSLSSSLDLSRESSFDSAQHHAPNEDASPSQSSLAEPVARDSTSAMQAEAGVNEQASVSLAPLPLDSTTGALEPSPEPAPVLSSHTCVHWQAAITVICCSNL